MATPAESAVDQVFRLPELLEMVLHYLSQKDLLLSQRVSRNFRDTISSSLRLQRALFFAPDWNLEGRTFNAYASNNRPGRKPENNRLLLRAFPGCYPTVTLVIMNDPPSPTDLEQGQSGGGEHWSWDVCISFPADRAPNTKPAVLYPEASWRRMYLSQPPCTALHLVRRWQRSLNPAIVREGGIKMGEFVDEATKSRIVDGSSSVSAPVRRISNDSEATSEAGSVPAVPGRRWHRSYISSDRDWHFEGNIKCSSLSLCDGDEVEVEV